MQVDGGRTSEGRVFFNREVLADSNFHKAVLKHVMVPKKKYGNMYTCRIPTYTCTCSLSSSTGSYNIRDASPS